ncbi:acyl-CoA/acyl-ACP dehydrogenase (plasmid) [Arthrobacter sp. TES]|nr:acyl-CoA/acyl-ACP dehydrogenase [Arthrobacter sp. TES]
MIDFSLTQEQIHWVEKAREFAGRFSERARSYDEAGVYPRENMNELRDAGFLKLAIPSEYGGLGNAAGFCSWLPHLVIEQVASACGGTAWCLMTHYHASGLLAGLGTEEQKRRIFRDVVENGALIATLGSEVQPQQMKAVTDKVGPLISFEAGMEPVEGGFIANARKGFCSTASEADYIIYWSQAPGTAGGSDGLTMSIIPRDTPGLSFLPGWEEAVGIRSSQSGGALFEDVFIPWESVMGEPGDYVQRHPYTFELSYAVFLLGLAQGAYDFLRATLKDRAFLQEDDTVMYALGEMSSEIQATRMSCWFAQWLWESEDFEEAHQASLRALHQAKATSLKVATQGFDVVGVRGLFKFNPLERIWRDIRTATLHTRESQFMRLLSRGELHGEKFMKQKYGDRLAEKKSWNDLLGHHIEPVEVGN